VARTCLICVPRVSSFELLISARPHSSTSGAPLVAGLKHRQLARQVGVLAEDLMTNSTASVFVKPIVAFNRGDTFVFGSWVCTADGTGSFQRRLTMTPNPSTGLVTLPAVVTGELAGKFGEISLFNQHADFELGSPPTRTRRPRGPSHASRLSSHHVRTPHSMSTSHMAYATLARPTRRLSLRTGPARRSFPTTPRTSTPSPATTRTPMSSTLYRTQTSPSPRSPRLSNLCQDQPSAWL
jgi:hypothetical protein